MGKETQVSTTEGFVDNKLDHYSSTDQHDAGVFEIDLREKVETLWKERRIIFLIALLFSFVGMFHYISAPDEFESTATLIQEVESSGGAAGGSALLRSLTGLNIQASEGNLSAAARGRAPLPINMYPLIVQSTDFQKDLINREVQFSTLNDTTMTLYDYFNRHYQPPLRSRVYTFIGDMTIFLPFTILDSIRSLLRSGRGLFTGSSGNNPSDNPSEQEAGVSETETIQLEDIIEIDDRLLSITPRERNVIERMRTRINISIGGGITEITTILPDPKAAAIVNAIIVDRIEEYITEYRIAKARQNLEDVLQQYEEARERYEDAQIRLAEYQDANLNVRSRVVATQEEYLRDQRNLRFNVYNSLAQEVEQSRLALNQQIPMFNVLEKPNIPTSSSTGSSDLVLFFSVVLGICVGSAWALLKNSFIFRNQSYS